MTIDNDLTEPAAASLSDGRSLLAAGRAADAWTRLSHALAIQPSEPVVLYVGGISAHAAGRLALADRLLSRARLIAPQSPEVAFATGNLRLDGGDPRAAETQFRRALKIDPQFDAARRALAEAVAHQGRLHEAEALLGGTLAADVSTSDTMTAIAALQLRREDGRSAERLLRRALAAGPGHARALFLTADALRRSGDPRSALGFYLRSLAVDMSRSASWQAIGLILWADGLRLPAIHSLAQALRLAPADDTCWFALAEICRSTEDWAGAARAYGRAVACAPERLDALIHLGNALDELDQRPVAATILRRALDRAPAEPKILGNLATVLFQNGDLSAARRLYRQSATLAPSDAVAHYNLGNADRQHLAVDDALVRYGRATAIDPRYATARWNEALTRLMAGDWTNGFARYEWRWRDRITPAPVYAPWWEGDPLAGRRIVLLAEQGFGDMIHFARYARAVAENGGRVVLECYPQLRRLFATLSPDIELIDVGASPGPVDLQADLMQLPLIFRSTPDRAYAPIPYFRPPGGGPRLPRKGGGLKLGLVWAGNPKIEKFHRRSATLQEFRPLLDVPGVVAYSLQVGPRAADIAQLGLVDRIVDLAPSIADFADTASFLSQLDLLVAVDTAVAHLAGALGTSVWMLPTYVPDWRWLLDRGDTPWYPTMRLYRQGEDRAWAPVIARVARDLARLAQSASAV